jgi:membrane protein
MAITRKKKHSPEARSRGREAHKPEEIPKSGWRDIALRVKEKTARDNLSIIAAGVAFYGLFAIFPAIAALVSIYGLVADPAQVQQQLLAYGGMLPEEALQILNRQLTSVAESAGGALTLGAIGGLLFALWSSARGTKSLFIALDIVYDEEEKRGFLKFNGQALLLTLGAILFVLVSLSLIAVLPAVLAIVGLPSGVQALLSWGRWPLLVVLVVFGLAVLYRYGPDRDQPQWRWVSWGAVTAAVLWVVVSALFSLYVSNFGNYNETYGSMGAVIILMMWFYLTAYMVLLGAEINAEMEHQTKKDTTRGHPRRMGEREAKVADTVGRQP